VVGIDVETYDPDLERFGPGWFPGGRGRVVGFSLAWGDQCGYWPLYHQRGGNVEDPEKHLAWIQHQLRTNRDVVWVAHNRGYDQGWLQVNATAAPWHCTWLMSATLDDIRRGHSLDQLMRDHLGDRKDEKLLEAGARHLGIKVKDIKKHLWTLPAGYVAKYAEVDALGTMRLYHLLTKELEKEELYAAYERERRLCGVLLDVRRHGVRVDCGKAERIRETLRRDEGSIQKSIHSLCGFGVDVWSADSISRGFEERGIHLPKTGEGRPSCTKEWLTSCQDELAKLILKERQTNKLRTTFIEGVILGHAVNGRLHPEVNQVRREDNTGGTDTGRFSYSNPNLQFLPARNGESAGLVRGCFIPDDKDQRWISADYSQQEPRLTVHFAELAGLSGAAVFAERYRTDPKTDMHTYAGEVTKLIEKYGYKQGRTHAKVLNLAIIYGQGDGTTCQKLGLPTEVKSFTGRDGREVTYLAPGPEGQMIIDTYHGGMPFVKELDEAVKRAARKRCFIKTRGGRKMRILNTNGEAWTTDLRKALNKLIQGSAADQTKEAMILCAEAGVLPKVQVHDELCFSACPTMTAVIREVMESALPLSVPSVVDIAVGANWGEAT
jgi:DNA polymerase I-like protein with 3'-5' exonuclease and polymerase domains